MRSIFPGWRYDSNHSDAAENGRIVFMWDPSLSVVTYLKTPQIMRLRAAKSCCKGINKSKFSGIEKRTQEAFENLQNVQTQMLNSPSQALFQQEMRRGIEFLILKR
ncbi:Uncharacterized protein Rs2_17725 [Raphanus sativus]|nr:Uncharacterized protein Rs2_17725 [Raphanus sativus]